WFSSVKNEKDERIDEITREGYIFDGWYDNPECTGSEVRSSVSNTEDTTLYAKWVVPVTVTLHANNGTEDVVITDKPGTYCTGITKPTKEGFVFAGWYTDSEFTNSWDNYSGTTNIDVYAKWVAAFDYSEYVGTYKGANIYSNGKPTSRTANASHTIEETGKLSGSKWNSTFVGAYETSENILQLSDGKTLYYGNFDDGRKFMVFNYATSASTDPIKDDIYLQVKMEDGESFVNSNMYQTYLFGSKVWAVKFTIKLGDTETEYNLVIDAETNEVFTDVTYVINGEVGSYDGLYSGSSYPDSIVIKKGEETLYTLAGGSSITKVE
ncbi:MAG: InlB B-repeat-containing protein, partial [Candidatus Onthovivens sp.]|nr:InlB B-repeat-containing protein [Candidatus Onthovivens sp.]